MVNEPKPISISDDDGNVPLLFLSSFQFYMDGQTTHRLCGGVSIQKRNLFFRPLKQEVTINQYKQFIILSVNIGTRCARAIVGVYICGEVENEKENDGADAACFHLYVYVECEYLIQKCIQPFVSSAIPFCFSLDYVIWKNVETEKGKSKKEINLI